MNSKELLNTAFRKAKNVRKKKKEDIEITKINAVRHYLTSSIKKRIKKTNIKLGGFEKELIRAEIDEEELRKEIRRMKKSNEIIEKLFKEFKNKMKTASKEEKARLLKAFYGRTSSVVKKLSFEESEKLLRALRRLPKLKNMPTLLIAGFPNVGKSEILKRLCKTKVKTAPYPFTTRKLLIGFIRDDGKEIQVIDTPGIFDRSFEEMKPEEKKAVIALKNITNKILFVIDPSETCGYALEDQERLLEKIKKTLKADIITVATKKDIPHDKKTKVDLEINALDEKDVEKLKKEVMKLFFK